MDCADGESVLRYLWLLSMISLVVDEGGVALRKECGWIFSDLADEAVGAASTAGRVIDEEIEFSGGRHGGR